MKYYHVPVRAETYQRLERYRAFLSLRQGRKVSLDETIQTLLSAVKLPEGEWEL